MSDDDTQANSGAADQNEGVGDDLDTNSDTDTGADDSQDTGDDSADDAAGDDDAGGGDGFKAKFEDQQRRANKAEGFLKAAGIDPKTGKPKESRAPKKDGDTALSDEQEARLAKAEDRAERAELRGIGITHSDDIQFVRDAAKRLGVDPVEAADDELVKSKLERRRAARKTKDNTPPPTNGRGPAPKKGKNAWEMSDEEFQKERSRIMSGS